MKRIRVGVAVIIHNGKILISKRHADLHQGGKWEFPGGKIEAGETESDAIIRELREELSITATKLEPLLELSHDYSDKQVSLYVWTVTDFTGTPVGVEGQPVKWIPVADLERYQFPDANYPIVKKLLAEFL